MDDRIILSVVFIFMVVSTIRNNTFGLKVCLFLIPYNLFSFKYFFGVNNAAVFGLVLGNILLFLVNRQKLFLLNRQLKYFLFAFFLIFIISLGIMFLGNVQYSEMRFYEQTALQTTPFFIVNLLTGPILFLFIIKDFQKRKNVYSYLKPFLISFLYYFVSWCGFYFNVKLPLFISYRMQGGGFVQRFTGLWGDYELTAELTFVYVVLSLVYIFNAYKNNQLKVFALIVVIFSIIIGLTTGTRALLVLYIFLGLAMVVYLLMLSKSSFLIKSFLLSFVFVMFFLTIFFMLTDSLFYSRINETLTIVKFLPDFNIENLQNALNRNYTDTYIDILEVGGLFGIGPVLVNTFRNSWMVYHNFYYHLTLCFGLIGFIIYIFFVGYIIIKLFSVALTNRNVEEYLIFSLIVILHIDQIKINYWRDSPTIQLYWYLFAIAYIFVANNKNTNEKSISYSPRG